MFERNALWTKDTIFLLLRRSLPWLTPPSSSLVHPTAWPAISRPVFGWESRLPNPGLFIKAWSWSTAGSPSLPKLHAGK